MSKKTFETILLGFFIITLFFYSYQMMVAMNEVMTSRVGSYYVLSVFLIFFITIAYLSFKVEIIISEKRRLVKILLLLFLELLLTNLLIPTEIPLKLVIVNTTNLLIPFLSFFYFFSLFSTREVLKSFTVISVLLTIGLIIIYYNEYNITKLITNKENPLNIAYFPLLLLPIILSIKNRSIRILLTLLIALVIFSSMKRGGFIAFLLSIAVYYITVEFFIKQHKFKILSFFSVIILLGTIIGGFFYYDSKYNDNMFIDRLELINEDQGSGRTDIYREVFELIQLSTTKDIIIGHGQNAVMRDSKSGFSAHNDFLEILYNFGLIVLITYLLLHIELIRFTFHLIRRKSFLGGPMIASYCLFLVFSLISHVIIYPYFVFLTAFWGMSLGYNALEIKKVKYARIKKDSIQH